MHIFATERFFEVSPAQLFAAMADPARLARWGGPEGFTNEFEVFEFHPGGRWHFTMVGPDGTRYANECVFLQIDAERCWVISHEGAPRFELTLKLAPEGRGTRLVWTQVLEDEAFARAMAHIIEPANEQNLDRLSQVLCISPSV